MEIKRRSFGHIGSDTVELIQLDNGQMQVEVLNYGCVIKAIVLKDNKDKNINVVAGFDTIEGYLQDQPFIGCIIGRYANRIANGSFEINGVKYQLEINQSPNSLHSGNNALDKKVWDILEVSSDQKKLWIKLGYLSKDGDGGFPGNMKLTCTYSLSLDNALEIQYSAVSDKDTIINLTNHSYFNLSGFQIPNILDHELWIDAENFTPKDETGIPTGKIVTVRNTPLNFNAKKKLGEDIHLITDDAGYDHNFIVNEGKQIKHVATLECQQSGVSMETLTTEPGMQVYTSNWMDGTLHGSQGIHYGKYCAVALETQHFPDSPNHHNFPNTFLKAGEDFQSKTIYKFKRN